MGSCRVTIWSWCLSLLVFLLLLLKKLGYSGGYLITRRNINSFSITMHLFIYLESLNDYVLFYFLFIILFIYLGTTKLSGRHNKAICLFQCANLFEYVARYGSDYRCFVQY